MKKINIKILPSIITLGNLFCGFLAIAYIADKKLVAAASLIFLGMVFDMLDGKVARLTSASSDFGMQLDSLTDVITFGVAPAFLVKVFILEQSSIALPQRFVWTFSLLFVICATLRLARFNVETEHDEDSHLYFKGLPTPAAAGVLASLVLISDIIPNSAFFKILMLSNCFILAFLMVSRVKYVHVGVHLLKKRRPLRDLVAIIFFLSLITVEPKIFILSIAILFNFYAFLLPLIYYTYKILKDDKKEILSEGFVESTGS